MGAWEECSLLRMARQGGGSKILVRLSRVVISAIRSVTTERRFLQAGMQNSRLTAAYVSALCGRPRLFPSEGCGFPMIDSAEYSVRWHDFRSASLGP
jgi:hypothetical protein